MGVVTTSLYRSRRYELIGTTFFYSYGFGLHGQVDPALGVLLTLVIFILQVLFSRWWLGRYRYGPMAVAQLDLQ